MANKGFHSFIKAILIFQFFGLSVFSVSAQEQILLEQNPPSVKWRQINTPSFRIIFPSEFEKEAQRMANTMQHLYEPVSKTFDAKPTKLSLILQNQTSVSNAFVTVAPRRSEFFTMPPQDYNFVGTNDWLNLLAVHEYRHVVQYEKSRTGFTKAMQLIFGGDIWSFIANVAVPNWFWEGDAVATETALTHSGRGRIPNFDLAFRTTLLERGPWNYYKQYLGSFKDFVPNYYVTGYHMVTHVRRKYGENAWPQIFKRSFNNPYLPFVFSGSIRKKTRYNVLGTYKNMINEVDSLWRWQVESLTPTESSKAVYRTNSVFTNYDYPQFLSDGKIIAQRSGLGNISQFVIVDSIKQARKIHTLGIVNDAGMLSIGGDKLVWSEFNFDPRWAVRNYSVIKLYDFKTKATKTITKKSRLSGCAISPDGKKIVAVENNTASQNTILILDANSGKEISRLKNDQNFFYAMPRWSNDGKHIVALKTTTKGKTIAQFQSNGEEEKELLPVSYENVGHPIQYNQYVLYNSPYSGIDNIYALNTETGERYQVTSKSFGAYNPAISSNGKLLAFNNFTKYGMDVEVMPFNPANWTSLQNVDDKTVKYYDPLVKQEANENILLGIPAKKYEVKKFGQLHQAFNPYTLYLVNSHQNREIGLSIHSQNLLSTAYAELGMTLNGNEHRPFGFALVSFQGLFPILDLEAGWGTRAIDLNKDNISEKDSIYSWTEKSLSFGARLPLNLTRNKYRRMLTLEASTKAVEVTNYSVPAGHTFIEGQGNGILNSMKYGLSFYSLIKQAPRDVTSRWGVRGFVQYNHTPFGGDYRSALFAAQGRIQIPGLLRHHGFQVRGGYQTQKQSDYLYKSPLFFTRGYSYRAFEDFYNTAVEYKFPIWNADIHLGPIFNFQRFKGKIFYDHGVGTIGNRHYNLESFGAEIHTDFNILRWYPLIEAGARYTYVPSLKGFVFDFLLFQFDL